MLLFVTASLHALDEGVDREKSFRKSLFTNLKVSSRCMYHIFALSNTSSWFDVENRRRLASPPRMSFFRELFGMES